MDVVYTELAKLHTLSGAEQSKWPSITSSLDLLLADLRKAKEKLHANVGTPQSITSDVLHDIEERKKAIDDRQKEVYNCLNRLSKGLDKVLVFTPALNKSNIIIRNFQIPSPLGTPPCLPKKSPLALLKMWSLFIYFGLDNSMWPMHF
jgi:hypothetical protein